MSTEKHRDIEAVTRDALAAHAHRGESQPGSGIYTFMWMVALPLVLGAVAFLVVGERLQDILQLSRSGRMSLMVIFAAAGVGFLFGLWKVSQRRKSGSV